ncbi:hypothetical protein [uncultured Methanobrevibacter sp.]|uniref:hypothetical protein n=1 Tax=uncultured Methanobrevibacter sp. TaxID=253161 RepID=UPI002639E0DA|nr:hypothetical protein [uncultured Methanobrevibacter sp.]
MATKQEDLLFKDVGEEEVDVFLKRIKIKSKKKKLNPTEIRYIDPTALIADLIIELDNTILIIEFQSTNVDIDDKDRFLAYLSMVNYKKKSNKKVKLVVISTAEESKKIIHILEGSVKFTFDIYSLMEEDGDNVINNIETKLENNKDFTDEELIDLSLVPLMGSENTQEQQIEKSVELILSIDLEKNKVKNLVKSIAYLLTDKFLEDGDKKTAICDALGGKMSAIYDYGQRREEEGIEIGKEEGIEIGKKEGNKKMAKYMIKNGETNEEIQKETELSLEEIEKIRKEI